jgi:hypothetical protein
MEMRWAVCVSGYPFVMTRLGFVLLVVVAGCGGSSLKKSGEACTSSSECDKGLLCDAVKHVCADRGSLDAALPDAPNLTDGGIDAHADARADATVMADAPDDAPDDAPPD